MGVPRTHSSRRNIGIIDAGSVVEGSEMGTDVVKSGGLSLGIEPPLSLCLGNSWTVISAQGVARVTVIVSAILPARKPIDRCPFAKALQCDPTLPVDGRKGQPYIRISSQKLFFEGYPLREKTYSTDLLPLSNTHSSLATRSNAIRWRKTFSI